MGIAASNIEVPGSEIHASTIHSVFDLDGGRDGVYTSNLDFSKPGIEKVGCMMAMKILLLDEVSMMDKPIFEAISAVLSDASNARGGRPKTTDGFGDVLWLGIYNRVGTRERAAERPGIR